MQKEKREIIYAIITIVVIPLLILTNTLYIISSIKRAYNAEFSEKADVLNTVMAESLRADITKGNAEVLAEKLNRLHQQQPVLSKLQILKEKDGEIVVVAKSSDSDQKLSSSASMQAKIAYERKYPIARLINITQGNSTTNAWDVITPLMDESNQKVIALLSSVILPGESQNMINRQLYTSLIFVVISMVVIFLLLLRHFRFAEYARLLAKQKEINQTMGNFLSVATHELKAPATIIKGYISNAIEDPNNPLPDDTKEQLNIALSQTDRLNNLVKDLLNVSRIEQGRIEYDITEFNLAELFKPIIQNYQLVAKDKNLEIINNLPENLMIKADQGRTQEIFTNLIDNAVKYSVKGAITISQAPSEKLVGVLVRDTGIGMNPEQRKQLFQRFYRIKSDKTKDISGTGLGLWIIKQYIESMGGSIEVNSMEDIGSEFIVYLPKV